MVSQLPPSSVPTALSPLDSHLSSPSLMVLVYKMGWEVDGTVGALSITFRALDLELPSGMQKHPMMQVVRAAVDVLGDPGQCPQLAGLLMCSMVLSGLVSWLLFCRYWAQTGPGGELSAPSEEWARVETAARLLCERELHNGDRQGTDSFSSRSAFSQPDTPFWKEPTLASE